MDLSLRDVLALAAERHPDRMALESPERSWTYGSLGEALEAARPPGAGPALVAGGRCAGSLLALLGGLLEGFLVGVAPPPPDPRFEEARRLLAPTALWEGGAWRAAGSPPPPPTPLPRQGLVVFPPDPTRRPFTLGMDQLLMPLHLGRERFCGFPGRYLALTPWCDRMALWFWFMAFQEGSTLAVAGGDTDEEAVGRVRPTHVLAPPSFYAARAAALRRGLGLTTRAAMAIQGRLSGSAGLPARALLHVGRGHLGRRLGALAGTVRLFVHPPGLGAEDLELLASAGLPLMALLGTPELGPVCLGRVRACPARVELRPESFCTVTLDAEGLVQVDTPLAGRIFPTGAPCPAATGDRGRWGAEGSLVLIPSP